LILLRAERVADEVINGTLDRGVILPAFELQVPLFADSDEVARAFRDDVARCSDMMSPGVRCLSG
jgi:hypothetical protein